MASYNLKLFIQYAAEAVDHFGYIKSWNDTGANSDSTWKVAKKFYDNDYSENERNISVDTEKEELGFNPHRPGHQLFAEEAIQWILSANANNDYMMKLQLIASQDRVDEKMLGFAASIVPTFNRHIEYIKKKEKEVEKLQSYSSHFVGEVGQKIVINVKSVELKDSWDSAYGLVFMYFILDWDNNIFIWKTGNVIGDDCTKLREQLKNILHMKGLNKQS